jgi:uncharacterized protein YndB with AHSA1/START domain
VTEESGEVVRIERTFAAPAEDVFDALLASERFFRRRMRRERRATEGPQAARSDLNNEAAPRGDAPGC